MSIIACSVDGCFTDSQLRRGMCRKHYQRTMRHGDPNKITPTRHDPRPDITGKYCVRCGIYQWHSEYGFASRGQDQQREGTCKSCVREAQRNNPAKYQRNLAWDKRQRDESTAWAEARKVRQSNVRHVRRARIAGAAGEPVDSAAIYRRDANECQICGEPIDMAARFPHPLSPSIDHVQPISKGGSHTYENVQAAHLRCNMSKGNREVVSA